MNRTSLIAFVLFCVAAWCPAITAFILLRRARRETKRVQAAFDVIIDKLGPLVKQDAERITRQLNAEHTKALETKWIQQLIDFEGQCRVLAADAAVNAVSELVKPEVRA